MSDITEYYLNKTDGSLHHNGSVNPLTAAQYYDVIPNEPQEMELVFESFSWRDGAYFRDQKTGKQWFVMNKELAEEFIPFMKYGRIDGSFKVIKRYSTYGLTKVL